MKSNLILQLAVSSKRINPWGLTKKAEILKKIDIHVTISTEISDLGYMHDILWMLVVIVIFLYFIPSQQEVQNTSYIPGA